MSDFVVVEQLTKRYGELVAVDNLSFTVHKGEIFGFLGPNGAGKSTTLNVLCSLTNFDTGTINVDGLDLAHNARGIRAISGLVPQEIAVYPNLTARENVQYFASLYGLRGSKLHQSVTEALEFVGLSQHAKMRVSKMSGGMKRRLNIACGIAHRPQLIVLDEPTVGVDAQSREHIMESIRSLRNSGATIIYTSHYMPEVQEICDRIAIIDHGKLVACGSEQELLEQVTDMHSIYITTPPNAKYDAQALVHKLLTLPDVRHVHLAGAMDMVDLSNTFDGAESTAATGVIGAAGAAQTAQTAQTAENLETTETIEPQGQIRVDVALGMSEVSPLLQVFIDANIPIAQVSSDTPNLETTFLALTGRELR
ncbi:ABC transporter ATP-binding protein [Actinomycetota bacterium]|nr:ABC transporter ATP-binding protein [Actinomycetota bacterium]